MDELYFVVSFQDLQKTLKMDKQSLKDNLGALVRKNYVKCFQDISDELPQDEVDFDRNYGIYHYLASKEGLFAHNSR